MGAGDDLRVGAAHVHIPLALDDVAAITLQPLDCKGHRTGQLVRVQMMSQLVRVKPMDV